MGLPTAGFENSLSIAAGQFSTLDVLADVSQLLARGWSGGLFQELAMVKHQRIVQYLRTDILLG